MLRPALVAIILTSTAALGGQTETSAGSTHMNANNNYAKLFSRKAS